MSELDTRIALLLGWRFDRTWMDETGKIRDLPNWSASLDAQQEILAGLRERGYTELRIVFHEWLIEKYSGVRRENVYKASIQREDEGFIEANPNFALFTGIGATPAEAMAEAICAALESEAKG